MYWYLFISLSLFIKLVEQIVENYFTDNTSTASPMDNTIYRICMVYAKYIVYKLISFYT